MSNPKPLIPASTKAAPTTATGISISATMPITLRKSSAICVAVATLARSAVRSMKGSWRTIWAIGVTKSDFSQSPITSSASRKSTATYQGPMDAVGRSIRCATCS